MTTENVLETEKIATQKNNFSSWWNQQKKDFEDERFARMSFFLIAQSCLGSLACAYLLDKNFGNIPLAICIMVTTMCNALLISQSSAKWCLRFFYASILINSFFIVTIFLN